MELIDTHCHLDLAAFDSDRDAVLAACLRQGVQHIVVPAVQAIGWDALVQLCRTTTSSPSPRLYPALGLHPIYVTRHHDRDIAALARHVADERPLAVGEIGLDFYIDDPHRARQQQLFEAQLGIARDAGLPVLLHVRKAHAQVIASLRRVRVSGGIAHAFNGSLQQAQQYIDLGFRLGFGGMLTYARARKLRALARALPAAALVLETDAPDMTVASHHGERNSPAYLPECLAALAEVRDEAPETLAAQTTANARAVLGLH